jgi:hypothetical protein
MPLQPYAFYQYDFCEEHSGTVVGFIYGQLRGECERPSLSMRQQPFMNGLGLSNGCQLALPV